MGKYKTTVSTLECVACPCGKYNAATGRTSCQRCQACPGGRWRKDCSETSGGACVACPVGLFKAYSTYQTLCSPRLNGVSVGCCGAATFAAQRGNVGWCPKGTFSFSETEIGPANDAWLDPTECQRVSAEKCHQSPRHSLACSQWEIVPLENTKLQITLHRNGKPGSVVFDTFAHIFTHCCYSVFSFLCL